MVGTGGWVSIPQGNKMLTPNRKRVRDMYNAGYVPTEISHRLKMPLGKYGAAPDMARETVYEAIAELRAMGEIK